MEFILSKI